MNKYSFSIIVSFVLSFALVIPVVLANQNEQKAESEHANWKQELSKWEDISSSWYKKVNKKYEMFRDVDVPEDGCNGENCWKNDVVSSKYCEGSKCWESDSTSYIFQGYNEGNNVEIDKNRCDISSNWFSTPAGEWNCQNGNQVLEFKGIDGSKWTSSNFGQVLKYIDGDGNEWSSSNFGQSIILKKSDGSSTSSSNFGQSLNNKESEDDDWSSDNFDGSEW